MPKFHFYDIECLNNIFTLTNYLPEENKVEQFFLPNKEIGQQIDQEPELLKRLTDRVRLRNQNFTPNRQTVPGQVGNGQVALYDLRKPLSNIKLAKDFGMSTADNVNNPLDATNLYPNYFRLTCDTDLENKEAKWQKNNVIRDYFNRLSNQNYHHQEIEKIRQIIPDLGQYDYHYYDNDKDPYLLGYNSTNYDLTLLAIYLQDAFIEETGGKIDTTNIYSHNQSGYHYFTIQPDSPESLRGINDLMFSSQYNEQMPSILYRSPDGMNFHNAELIRRNMLRTGRHLDVSVLNEKMKKVGLKRLLGMTGYQILESDKLRPGTANIENMDQFYDLLAYNASDCINLAALFFDDRKTISNFYMSQFELKQTMLKTYPMIVYDKRVDSYAPDIAPDKVKKNRMYIDSTSAQIATNVVCPYGHLDDISAVSFKYPELRKSKEVHIPQFNVLQQTKDFFKKRVYEPALKTNPTGAEKALTSFNRIMNLYSYIQGKNLNDSVNYYRHQLMPYQTDKKAKLALREAKDQDFANLLTDLNTFDLLSSYSRIRIIGKLKGVAINVPQEFIKANKIDYDKTDPNKQYVTLDEFIKFIDTLIKHGEFNRLAKDLQTKLLYIEELYRQYSRVIEHSTKNKTAFANLSQSFNVIANILFNYKLTLGDWQPNEFISDVVVLINDQPLKPLKLRPYVNSDFPVGNYCLPFFDKNCNPTSGYALFSLGGVHGAEYNKALYDQDHAKKENVTQLDLFNLDQPKDETSANDPYPLFKKTSSGFYALNERYVYTSIDFTNHEDFSSYYPSLCRMLNVYWNKGIGKDIYGEVYDRKEKLGTMMKDKKYTPAQRAFYHNQRQGTKLILNSTTGKGDSHRQNSPIQMNNNIMSMRLIGQMFTWRIGQAQTLVGAKVVSTNTDGLYTVMDDTELNAKILNQESAEIHVRIDPERLYLISKDANNRIEENKDDFAITTPSGGQLAAFNGPTPIRSLAHPAAIDRALGLYLQEIGKPDSPYYDKTLMKHFDRKLGMKIIKNILGSLHDLPSGERRKKKIAMLNYYQNIVSSSPGSDRYIFLCDNFYPYLNDMQTKENQENKKDIDYNVLPGMEKFITHSNKLSNEEIHIMQHYNRVFYVKEDAPFKTYHLYVAAGRVVSDKSKASREKDSEPIYQNSLLAKDILQRNGVDVAKLNARNKEAQIVKLPSLPPQWTICVLNQSLESLTEAQIDQLLDNLDWNHYLELFEHTYIGNWCNNVAYQSQYEKTYKKKYEIKKKRK